MSAVLSPKPMSRAAFVLVVAFVALLDLGSKAAMAAWLAPTGRVIEVTPFFNLRLGYNPGVSFGLFPAESDLARYVLIGFALTVTCCILWFGLRSQQGLERLGFGLIAGGALGNVIDRSRNGSVTDFVDLHAFGWHFPTFNIADIAISTGVLALIVSMFFAENVSQPKQDHR